MTENGLDRRLNPDLYGATHAAGAEGGGGGGGGGGVDIDVDPDVLEKRSGVAGEVHRMVGTEGRLADDTTNAAAGALSAESFQLGRSLKITGDLWYSQMTTLIQACHKIEQSLAANAKGHRLTEDKNEMRMTDIAAAFK
jgi:uncharacterized protein YukE